MRVWEGTRRKRVGAGGLRPGPRRREELLGRRRMGMGSEVKTLGVEDREGDEERAAERGVEVVGSILKEFERWICSLGGSENVGFVQDAKKG